MNLPDIYQQKIYKNRLQDDFGQKLAIAKLQNIGERLIEAERKKRLFFNKKPSIKGLYLWGEVGRGKTFLMDIFFNALPIRSKKRSHFNHFIKNIHRLLKANQGKKNPLNHVAKIIAANTIVICFDEFMVEDIADAMMLGALFKQLFSLGVTLVTTSNVPPYRLYQGGLQRNLFLPAIDLLETHLEVMNLDQGLDYRRQINLLQRNYFFPTPSANKLLKSRFAELAAKDPIYNTIIQLESRSVSVVAVATDCIWFDFFAICGTGRGVNDYIALTRQFKTIFTSNIPVLTTQYESEARRFIAMVDECYDQNKQLVISAASHFSELYQGKRLKETFQRTISRLYEMC